MQYFSKRSKRIRSFFVFALGVSILGSSFPIIAVAGDASLKAEAAINISGDDLAGEDPEIRRVAVDALGTAAGTVVVMNARTGRIYTIVNQEWAIRNAFKPCSTIKLVTGVAGIKENLIAPNGALTKGNYRLGLDEALAYSNNTFFQRVGANLGSEKMIAYARELGLGEPTGINAEGETSGKLPYGNENLRIYSHADDFEASPLQLAVLVSAITNGGKLVVPLIPRTRNQKANFRGYLRRELALEPYTFERVIPGMLGAVDYGTAKIIDSELQVGGKTGSCISEGTWVGLFASVAPLNDPRFSVVVITKGQNARGKYSAAIAGQIYRALRPRFDQRNDNTLLARNSEPTYSPRKTDNQQKVRVIGRDKPILKNRQDEGSPIRKAGSIRPAGTGSTREASKQEKPKSIEELFPTVVIVKGKPEITRPRVVND